jgi:hypothetical protein
VGGSHCNVTGTLRLGSGINRWIGCGGDQIWEGVDRGGGYLHHPLHDRELVGPTPIQLTPFVRQEGKCYAEKQSRGKVSLRSFWTLVVVQGRSCLCSRYPEGRKIGKGHDGTKAGRSPGPNLSFVWRTFQHAKAVFLFIPATVVAFDMSGLGRSTNGKMSALIVEAPSEGAFKSLVSFAGRAVAGEVSKWRHKGERRSTMFPSWAVGLVHDVDGLRAIIKFIPNGSWATSTSRSSSDRCSSCQRWFCFFIFTHCCKFRRPRQRRSVMIEEESRRMKETDRQTHLHLNHFHP